MHRLEEKRVEFGEARRDHLGCDLFFAFAAEILELHHSHRPGGALELVEDPLCIGEAALSEGAVN